MFGVGTHPYPQRLLVMLIQQSNDHLVDWDTAKVLVTSAHQTVTSGAADPDRCCGRRHRRHTPSLQRRLQVVYIASCAVPNSVARAEDGSRTQTTIKRQDGTREPHQDCQSDVRSERAEERMQLAILI